MARWRCRQATCGASALDVQKGTDFADLLFDGYQSHQGVEFCREFGDGSEGGLRSVDPGPVGYPWMMTFYAMLMYLYNHAFAPCKVAAFATIERNEGMEQVAGF
jgi:hypothetical protein